jgi:hypothetical protein
VARIRFEFWDNGNNLQEVEAEHIDPLEAFERAVRMARAALPPKPKLEPGSYSMVLNNVQFDQESQMTLFGQVASDVEAGEFKVRLRGTAPAEKGQCQELCPGHSDVNRCRCCLPLGHATPSHQDPNGCSWFEDPERCLEQLKFSQCAKPRGHAGQHVDNARCSHCCREGHASPAQCSERAGHEGPHSTADGGSVCSWSAVQCDQRIHWLGVGYPCRKEEGHEGPCESATGIRWEFGNSVIWCKGKWGAADDRWGDNGLACRLPEGHKGECGPLPEPEPEVADCA